MTKQKKVSLNGAVPRPTKDVLVQTHVEEDLALWLRTEAEEKGVSLSALVRDTLRGLRQAKAEKAKAVFGMMGGATKADGQ